MAEITLDNVSKVFSGGVVAVDGVSLTIGSGEFLVLVGPSGCGKSTLLRMIAGLEDVTAGTISIGEVDVTDLAPRSRDIAMVFQSYALYPHMTVRQNLGYGLKVRKTPKQEIRERVTRAADLLGLDQLLDRKPAALSGGVISACPSSTPSRPTVPVMKIEGTNTAHRTSAMAMSACPTSSMLL